VYALQVIQVELNLESLLKRSAWI